jgi:MFS family permease
LGADNSVSTGIYLTLFRFEIFNNVTIFTTTNRLLPSSMRYGHFRYYWLALLAGVTGHQMLLQFTMGWLVFELTGEARYLAFLGIAIAIPALALNLLGGVLADRLEPKFLVAGAQGISASVVALLAVLVLTGQVAVWHVLATAVIIGALQAFDQPSRSSIFPRLVKREDIVNAVAMESIVWNAVRVLAPALAGIVIDRLSIHASMFFSAATFFYIGGGDNHAPVTPQASGGRPGYTTNWRKLPVRSAASRVLVRDAPHLLQQHVWDVVHLPNARIRQGGA